MCGRNWLEKIEMHSGVFKDELDTLRGVKTSVTLNLTPKVRKSRPLPFTMKVQVDAELGKANMITPVKH